MLIILHFLTTLSSYLFNRFLSQCPWHRGDYLKQFLSESYKPMPPSALLREYENLRRIDFLEVNEEGKRFFEVAKEKLAEDPETLKIVTDCLCKVVWTAIDSDTSREFKTAKALIEVAKANAVKITLEASETHSGQPVACATVLDVLLAKKDAPLSLVREGLLLSVDPCEPVEKIWQSLPENIKGLIQRQKKDVILSLRINPLSRKHFIKKYLAKEPEFFMRDLRHEVQREIELSNLKGGAYEEENSHLKGPNRHALLNIIMRVSLHLNRDERRLERTRREFDGIISDLGKVSCAHSRFGIFDLIKHAHLSGEDRRDVDKRLEETFLFNEYDQKPKFIAKLERQRSTHKKPSSDEGLGKTQFFDNGTGAATGEQKGNTEGSIVGHTTIPTAPETAKVVFG